MKKKTIKILFIFLLFLSFAVISGCNNPPNNDNNGNENNQGQIDDKEDNKFIYRAIEPDEFGDDTMAVLPDGYTLIWTDEFNYTGSPDPAKWNYEIGGGGWGNNESQFYTNRDDNSYVDNGYLTITAKKEAYNGYQYTSARLTSKNKGDFKYGYIEFRAIIPTGVGTWPALWMMPTDSVYGGWPRSGEIDIMETTGRRPTYIQGTTHTAGGYGGGGVGGATTVATSTTEWHTYGCEWDEQALRFKVDGKTYFTYNHLSNWTSEKWPYDQRFFLIMNIAMGGNMGGSIASDFSEASMKVDYVRVYSKVDTSDNEAPGQVEIKNYVPSYNSIYIEWDKATDNQGIKQYDVVVNNKQIGATMANNYTIKDLEEATTYQIRVISVDYNGNYTLSDIYTIKTLTEPVLPGKVKGTDYTSASKNVSVAYVTSENSNCLQVAGGCEVGYIVKCGKSESYNVNLRLAVLKNSNVSIEITNGQTTIYTNNLDVSSTYGKYTDLAFPEVNLPTGELNIKITCTASGTGNAIIINYLSIE